MHQSLRPSFSAPALAIGVVHLLALRFEHGDIYPPYSTLRTDPLGAKVFYDALDSLPGSKVSRNYRSLPQWQSLSPITYVYSGVKRNSDWYPAELQTFQSLVAGGTRAVFAFAPEQPGSGTTDEPPEAPKQGEPEKARRGRRMARRRRMKSDHCREITGKKEKASGSRRGKSPSPKLPRAGAANLGRWPSKGRYPFKSTASLQDEASGLEREITWLSGLYFADLQPPWHVLYRCEGEPVVIERRWGDGSIVFASDSYFLSNEAMRRERHPEFLASLIGPSSVVFDEEHHGVHEEPNIAMLTRKYRLQGCVAALVLVAALFIWKSVVKFVPPYAKPRDEEEIVRGRDSAEGLVNLLRRSVSKSTIFETCVAEWRKAFSHESRATAVVDAAIAASATRDPVASYRQVASTLQNLKSRF